jgi:signal transduction histidine kinase
VLTIRFKLTLLYSVIVFLVCGTLNLALNIYLNSYLQADPIFHGPIQIQTSQQSNPQFPNDFDSLQIEERTRIQEIRMNDLKQIQNLSILAMLPIAVISFLIGYIMSGRFLKPIDDLRRNIDTLSHTDLGQEIPVDVEDEVGKLVKSFNELSSRLKESFDSQERFVQDASHEIKTPLTIIQTNLDTILDDKNATTTELQQAMSKALLGVKSLKNLTNYLLDLTVSQQVPFSTINLSKLLETEKNKLSDVAKLNGVALQLKLLPKDIFIQAQQISLGQAISNIIDNAIKYRDQELPSGESKVNISLTKVKRSAVIEIWDNGIGIQDDSVNKVFDRFYRVDKSRNKKTGGFGLGLSITKKVIQEHRGKISVRSKKNNTVFTIIIPIAE